MKLSSILIHVFLLLCCYVDKRYRDIWTNDINLLFIRCLSDSTDISLNSWALNFESPSKHSSISVLQHNEDSQSSVISTNSEVRDSIPLDA